MEKLQCWLVFKPPVNEHYGPMSVAVVVKREKK